jgi:competence protein ComEC
VLILLSGFAHYFSFASIPQGFMTVVFLDVGQGDAIYIEAPNGVQFIVDGGPINGGLLPQLGEVMPYYDRTIDGIMVTNPDTDHYAGFLDVLPRYQIGAVFEPGTHSDTSTYASFERMIEEKRISKTVAKKGQRIFLDKKDGVYLDIIFPDRDVSNWVINDGSVIARLVYGSTSVMLQGDAPRKIEEYLVNQGEDVKAQILKVGHHGSKTSSSDKYVTAVDPDLAVISLGKNNRYGFPHKETVDTFAKESVPILRTDLEGQITFVSNGKKFTRK